MKMYSACIAKLKVNLHRSLSDKDLRRYAAGSDELAGNGARDTDGRRYNWHLSTLRAAKMTMQKWVRVQANVADGMHEAIEATESIPNPKWPEMIFREMLKLCFEDRFIDSLEYPILKQWQGEV